MAIDNFCEGKNMEEYEVLKKAAAELNEIMHAAHINASDRAVYASGMLLAMHVLTRIPCTLQRIPPATIYTGI